MNPLRCLITDDEPFARKGLQRYVQQLPFLELRGLCADAQELAAHLQQEPVDLLFLDIEMPGRSGLDFLRALPEPRPQVIFTTAYEQYALAGFELDVLDYLVKPISFERFVRAAGKAYDYFRLRRAAPAEPAPGYVFVKAEGRLEKVTVADIRYVEALENYVVVHLPGRRLITHSTLKALLARLPAGALVQTHKSYAVAPAHIDSLAGNTLRLGPDEVPISKLLRAQVLAQLGLGAA
ncbi:LytTR family DNA-binding domain-containing protein [Hymenobacter sp. 15J16-1T3B]|uniref:LytR/AlgR family response regulator transcription factor n=1 Tax=Hymenobacter sp. 15J16-1T3B TaxID=2886941 RepID=UPI001D128221|nr:LytTR family DNA-binding domain-containing protein [Hymenobacter sp. 15J16-1T3B]MCC3158249.1 LytTR family DNA-binding domain-containing protein [Hymenobacter sp. 15J16-1T3B]